MSDPATNDPATSGASGKASEPVPERFRGAWKRVSIAFAGGPPAEHADVVWLQAERHYADLRVPHPGCDDAVAPMSFAGATTWEEPFLRWGHDLDLDPERGPGHADVGRVRWDGQDLIETGSFVDGERRVTYQEVWRRMAGATSPQESAWSADGTGVTVRAGDHSLTIVDGRAAGGEYRACYRTWRQGRWCVELALGPGAADLPVPPTRAMDPAMGAPTR